MPKKKSPPKYSRHSSGQARVRISGRVYYLGSYGSKESRQRYAELINEWSQTQQEAKFTVSELVLCYFDFAKRHYVKNGKVTSEISCVRTALRYVVALYGDQPVEAFGPKALKCVRQSMIADQHCRESINKHVGRVRRMFRWAVENEYVSPIQLTGLAAVQGLQAGRTEAVESAPVEPVSIEAVEAIQPFVTPPVWGAVQTQLWTGARPGEVLSMRVGDIVMGGSLWEYRPIDHKTKHSSNSASSTKSHGTRPTIRNAGTATTSIRG